MIFAKVKVNGGEKASLGDIAVECRNKKPCSEVIPRDVRSDSVPDFQGGSMAGWFRVGLSTGEIRPTSYREEPTCLLS